MKNLIVFNLEMDEESFLLRSNIDWIEELAKKYDKVICFTVHLGIYNVPRNVEVHEISGGSVARRMYALFYLGYSAARIIMCFNGAKVLHHMIHSTAIYPGILLKLFGFKQGLWYSHEVSGVQLQLASKIVDYIFTPSSNSFPFSSHKLHVVGQGVKQSLFLNSNVSKSDDHVGKVVSVGRVSRIKRYEKFLNREKNGTNAKVELCIVGPITNPEYAKEIAELGVANNIYVQFSGPLKRLELPNFLKEFVFYFSGTNKGIDRAALEASFSGCLVVSDNLELLLITGMTELWKNIGIDIPKTAWEQYAKLASLDKDTLFALRILMIKYVCEHSSLDKVIERIESVL